MNKSILQYDAIEIAHRLAKLSQHCVMYLSYDNQCIPEKFTTLVPYLDEENLDLLCDSRRTWLEIESEQIAEDYFKQTKCADTEFPIYAYLAYPDGDGDENT